MKRPENRQNAQIIHKEETIKDLYQTRLLQKIEMNHVTEEDGIKRAGENKEIHYRSSQ